MDFPIRSLMDQTKPYGLYLYHKGRSDLCVLRDLLQFLRVQNPGKGVSFAYVEVQSSLIPHLSLWDNLHVAVGGHSWKDFVHGLDADWKPLAQLVQRPDTLVAEASDWDKLLVGLLKGLVVNAPNLLVDMNEELHAPLNLQNFKKMLQKIATTRDIYLATSNTSLWLDSCHSVVTRKGYQFEIQDVGSVNVKRPKTA